MKLLKIFICILLFVLWTDISSAYYWIYYWTNKNYNLSINKNFDYMIVQPYNLDLYNEYKWKKICYLSVWEFDWSDEELTNLWLEDSKIWINEEWWSIIIDMNNQKWLKYIIKKEKELKKLWCNWLFLDTIWNDWQEKWWIKIVKTLRKNWDNAYIIVNNPHNIKLEIANYIDWVMFENFWDIWTKQNTTDSEWYLNLSKEYKEIYVENGKIVLALSYWDPSLKNKNSWWKEVLNLTNTYWFELIFSNYDLTKIYAYKKDKKILKLK